MKKMQVNSPEYRALVSSLLGKEVKFEDVPQIEVRKSPPAPKKAVASPPPIKKSAPLSKKSVLDVHDKYVIISTGYTARLVKKFGELTLIEKGKGKNNDVHIIGDPLEEEQELRKLVFIYDKLWGKGLYSAAPLAETVELLALLKNAKVDLNGSVVFRVDDFHEGDDLVFTLKDLDYCVMWTITDDSVDEASDNDDQPPRPYMKDNTFKLGNKSFRFIDIDCESG